MKNENGVTVLPDGSGFFVAEVDVNAPVGDPICWNRFNKVVHDHRTGDVIQPDTDRERVKRGLLVPWTPEIGNVEVYQTPVP